ncbi:MAG: NAD(P)/FAD-dependent oxidoreductase, partial [Spirochaetia bacterium]
MNMVDSAERFDAIVVGAGFAGMHMLWELRRMGLSTLVLERGSDVGGTWYWNRYPGARCDVPSMDYSVPWDPELDQEWNWTERFSTQPEILSYAKRLADDHDLRRDIKFGTSVTGLRWNDADKIWQVETDQGQYEAQFVISAAGALSTPNIPDIPGIRDFAGEVYHTGRWPHEKVSLKGKRVAVLGTGSTGIQAATAIGKEAEHLYVLQRTPQFSLPCHTHPLAEDVIAARKATYPEHREWQRSSHSATWVDLPVPYGMKAFDDPLETRLRNYETCWNAGMAVLVGVYADVGTDLAVNTEVSDFVRDKIRATVNDPVVAEKLCPRPDAMIGSRRIIIDTGYYQMFNQPNVTLVDIHEDPIVEITANGVRLASGIFHDLDMLVIATGYDAVTGPLLSMNIVGKNDLALKDAWAHGPRTNLGLMVAGFPNFFTITGPGSPGVLANVIYSIDQHVGWIAATLQHMRETGAVEMDTTEQAQDEWQEHAAEVNASKL